MAWGNVSYKNRQSSNLEVYYTYSKKNHDKEHTVRKLNNVNSDQIFTKTQNIYMNIIT